MAEKEYIERMKVISVIKGYEIENCPEYMQDWVSKLKRAIVQDITDDVMKIPAADVVEVRHEEWMVEAYPVGSDEVVLLPYKEHQHNEPFCSICGGYALLNGGEEYLASNYCPNCGAKMDGERKDYERTD